MHLRGIKRELDEYGFTLKTETRGKIKRNVKFNDAERTLYLDVLYPGDIRWTKITYEQARDGNRIANASRMQRPIDFITGATSSGRLGWNAPPTTTSTPQADRSAGQRKTTDSEMVWDFAS